MESTAFIKNGHNHLLLQQLLSSRVNPDEIHSASEAHKIRLLEEKFRDILVILGLDPEDDSLRQTPRRMAKMYVQEIFSGLNPENEPQVTLFDNVYDYSQPLIEKDIPVFSTCEHHFVPIIGKAHIGYIPGGKVIGLSKLSRIVHYYARRPQVQERLTNQIARHLTEVLGHNNVAVMISAEHLCVAARGVRDSGALTITSSFHGQFLEGAQQDRFLSMMHLK